jgi:Rap/ran-GAP.
LKVGVIYVKEGQYTEEEILDNNENSALFNEFLQILGDRVRLKGKFVVIRTETPVLYPPRY